MPSVTDWVVPTGQPLGVDAQNARFSLRTGDRIEELDEHELLAWGALAGLLEDPPQWLTYEVAGERVEAVHRGVEPALGSASPIDYLDLLCERGLAARVGADDFGVQQFLTEHRFAPNLVGLWPSPSDPNRRFVGFDVDAILSLPQLAYAVYIEAAAHPTVQDACAAVALRTTPDPDAAAEQIARVRDAFMGTARVIVAIGGGFFDRVTA